MKATRLSPHAHTLLALVAAYDEAHHEAMPLSTLQAASGINWLDFLLTLRAIQDEGRVLWLSGENGDESTVRVRS